jgi:hypothetical protein
LNWIEFYYKIWMAAKSWCFQMFPDVEKMEKMSNVSRCGRQGTTWAYGPNLTGHSISLPDRFAYTVHIYNFVRDFTRAAFF